MEREDCVPLDSRCDAFWYSSHLTCRRISRHTEGVAGRLAWRPHDLLLTDAILVEAVSSRSQFRCLERADHAAKDAGLCHCSQTWSGRSVTLLCLSVCQDWKQIKAKPPVAVAISTDLQVCPAFTLYSTQLNRTSPSKQSHFMHTGGSVIQLLQLPHYQLHLNPRRFLIEELSPMHVVPCTV